MAPPQRTHRPYVPSEIRSSAARSWSIIRRVVTVVMYETGSTLGNRARFEFADDRVASDQLRFKGAPGGRQIQFGGRERVDGVVGDAWSSSSVGVVAVRRCVLDAASDRVAGRAQSCAQELPLLWVMTGLFGEPVLVESQGEVAQLRGRGVQAELTMLDLGDDATDRLPAVGGDSPRAAGSARRARSASSRALNATGDHVTGADVAGLRSRGSAAWAPPSSSQRCSCANSATPSAPPSDRDRRNLSMGMLCLLGVQKKRRRCDALGSRTVRVGHGFTAAKRGCGSGRAHQLPTGATGAAAPRAARRRCPDRRRTTAASVGRCTE